MLNARSEYGFSGAESHDNFIDRLLIGDICDPFIEFFYLHRHALLLFVYQCEADEMWSFVGKKTNKQWIWLAMNTANRQIIGLHIGGRSSKGAQKLWKSIPEVFRKSAAFFTDHWKAYESVVPEEKHCALGKGPGFTNHQERFNLTLRQRVSRLVRANLAFSKKQENHVGAIKYFICGHNKKIAHNLACQVSYIFYFLESDVDSIACLSLPNI